MTCENLCEIAGATLESASSAGHETIVRLLLHNYATTFNKDGSLLANIILKSASAGGQKDAVFLLLKNGVDIETTEGSTGLTPLNMACRFGKFAVARLLVENGATINSTGKNEAQHPQQMTKPPLFDAIERGHSDIARYLIEEGADIFCVCSNGHTALWSACYWGNEIIARMLIDRGADVNVRASSYSDLPEQNALEAAEARGHSAIVRLLKENGAC